jgi:DNA-directed RNA polymerase alpha subunit
MIFIMPAEPPSDTPLGDLLPAYVTHVLAKNGIHTVEAVRRAYPHELLKLRGMGMLRFTQIEKAFFPDKSFEPALARSPIRQIKGSTLNGLLAPETVQTLARGGIMTAEQLCSIEPKNLLKIRSLGVVKLREIERAFFLGQHYEIPRGRRPAPTLPDSTGNAPTSI